MKTLLAVLFLGFAAFAAHAQSVTLAWDRVMDASVAGYRVYYGVGTRSYTNSVAVPGAAVTTVSITNLVRGATYHFAATSYTASSLESDYSAEVTYTVPVKPPVPQNVTIKMETP